MKLHHTGFGFALLLCLGQATAMAGSQEMGEMGSYPRGSQEMSQQEWGPGQRGPRQHRGQGGMGRFWKNPRAVEYLQLTNEQITSLETLDTAFRDQTEPLRTEMKELKTLLDQNFESPNADRREIMKVAKDIDALRSQLFRTRIEHRWNMQQQLNPDQVEKLAEMRQQRAERHERRGPGAHRGGYGGGQGGNFGGGQGGNYGGGQGSSNYGWEMQQ